MSEENKNNIFDTGHLKTNIKIKSLRSIAVTMTSQGLQFAIQIVSTMILARILTPADYGIIAMVVTITGFADLFLYLGLATATIQRPDVNHDQVSTLFWINTGMGILLTFIVAGFSPAIAWFYDSPKLLWVALSLSTVFLINGSSVQHQALLTRQMRFISLAAIQIGSICVGLMFAVFFALKGYGYWALVFNNIIAALCAAISSWMATKWVPGLPRPVEGVGSMIKFGLDLFYFNIIDYFYKNLDKILIGKFHGSCSLGLYSRAYQLMMMPITNLKNPMVQVVMPALSRLQNEPEAYRNYYIKFLSALAFVTMPIVAFLYVCSDQIINIVLGTQWMEASQLFKILAFVAFVQPVSSTSQIVLVSTGRTRRYLVLGVLSSAVICIAFIAGIPWGAKGVAFSYAAGSYLLIPPMIYLSFKNTPIKFEDFIFAVFKPFFSSLIMAIFVSMLVLNNFKFLNDILILTICLTTSIIVYLFLFVVFFQGLKEIREYYKYIQVVIGKKQ